MAQLRDAQTSEVVAVGEPLDLLVVWDASPADSLLWDDVPPGMDLDAMRRQLDELLDGMDRTAKRAEASRRDELRSVAEKVAQVASTAQNPDVPTMAHVEV